MLDRPRPISQISGNELREMLSAATRWLGHHVEAINAINVFPVPDGDTGTNMYLTMRATIEEAHRSLDGGVSGVLGAMSRGALMGARGNGGVILSQILRGWARAAEGNEHMDGSILAAALSEGAAAAYRALSRPVEGTILTVARKAAEAAQIEASRLQPDLLSVLRAATEAARLAVDETPSQLPVLAEAGVVDAGGQGFYILLEGALRYLEGEGEVASVVSYQGVQQEWLTTTSRMHESGEALYGYCTEFLLMGQGLDTAEVRERIAALGDSVLVVGDEQMVRVHVHTEDPGAAISYGTSLGSLSQVKVDNMELQYQQRFRPMQSLALEAPAVATVAVAFGGGTAELLRSLGVTAVVQGQEITKPSADEIVAAVEACPSQDVIVLPNHKDVLMAARQAAQLSDKRVHVVETTSLPQGVAALLSLNPDADAETNVRAMTAAKAIVRTVEVTRAVRSTTIGGVRVEAGQAIAIIDGELSLATGSPEEAVVAALGRTATAEAGLITIYYGADTSAADAQALASRLRQLYPSQEVELVNSGQPHYHYIVSVE